MMPFRQGKRFPTQKRHPLSILTSANVFYVPKVMLGNSIEDGVLAWYQIGVNPAFSRKIMAV